MPSSKRHGSQTETLTLPVHSACRFDFDTPNQLRCRVCRDHQLLLLLPERRAAMLALLLKQGQLIGQAKNEAERDQESQRPHSSVEERSAKRQAKTGRPARLRRQLGKT